MRRGSPTSTSSLLWRLPVRRVVLRMIDTTTRCRRPRCPAWVSHAAWSGQAGVVAHLLGRGADVTIRSPATYDTPLAWAALASGGDDAPAGAHVAVAELLVAAGDPVEERFLEVAGEELRAWLEERVT